MIRTSATMKEKILGDRITSQISGTLLKICENRHECCADFFCVSLDSNYADNIPYEDNLSSYDAGVMFFLSSKIFSPFCVGIFLSFNTP